jgi:peptide/nickel transport system permease protein
VGREYQAWDSMHLLGTDNLGRDMLSRLIYGARNTVGIAFATTALAFILGSVLGLLAAVVGGWLDQLLSRTVDVLMAIPALIFALLLLTIVGTSIINMILVIAVIDATRVYRLARAVAMNIVVMDYVEAAKLGARAFGASSRGRSCRTPWRRWSPSSGCASASSS